MENKVTHILYVLLLLIMPYLVACDNSLDRPKSKPTLESIKTTGELLILTRNAPTTYYQDKDGLAGFEYDLITDFAQSIKVTPKFIIKDSTSEILKGFEKGEAHIAAAGLTQTQSRQKKYAFGPVYQKIEQQLVCRRGSKIPKTTDDLVGIEIWVTAASSYVESLKKFQKILPELTWKETTEFSTEQLLGQVWQKKISCTIADSNIVSINRRYHPQLVVAFNFDRPESLSWLIDESAKDLQIELEHWFSAYKKSGELAATIERYYGFVDLFNYVDLKSFKKSITKQLPKYKQYFQEAAQKHDLSWTLLAAQSYQESHWRSRAKSPTGVRGLMMLTLDTAKEMGIKNRIDAKNSIFGGAKYMQKLNRRIPKDVTQPDRTWFALAAYNVGMGHIYDARILAKELNKDPTKWHDLVDVLPLLSQKKYYKKLKYGYARGNEPVNYVQRIRHYHDILEREVTSQAMNSVK